MSDEKRVYIDPSVLSNIAIQSMLKGQTPTTDPSRPVFPAGPEPDRVYGYVAFVDPTTGAEHLPRFLNGMTMGIPGYVTLRFVSPTGETRDLEVDTNYHTAGYENGAIVYADPNWSLAVAWYYDIQLSPDQAVTGPPTPIPNPTLAHPRTAIVTYNPDAWRFLDVTSIGYWQGYTESGARSETVDFHRRPESFPDLPDNP